MRSPAPAATGFLAGTPRALRVAATNLALFLAFCSPAAATQPQNILVIYSFGRFLPVNIAVDQGLRAAIQSPTAEPVIVFDEFLDVPRFAGEKYLDSLAAFIREKYREQQPAVIVAVGEKALDFVVDRRAALFPQAPVVHLAVYRTRAGSRPLPADVVGSWVAFDYDRTIDQALRWHPQVRRLLIVIGTRTPDRRYDDDLKAAAQRFAGRLAIEILEGLPNAELSKRLRELGDDVVVLTNGFYLDEDEPRGSPRESARRMAAATRAPVYGPYETWLGNGIVGGYMTDIAAVTGTAGKAISQLLAGAAPATLSFPAIAATRLNVDWRQLRRFGIAAEAIPYDAVVHFGDRSVLEEYRPAVIATALVMALQAGLILLLMYERRARRRAESAIQNQRAQLAHAARLAVAGELTGAIAHEINQPLAAILSNAEAAELMLESGPGRLDELRAILADIRRDDLRASEVIRRLRALLARQAGPPLPFELNEALRDAVSMLGSEARRRETPLDFRPAETDIVLSGDKVQLQQVVINLLLNATDAVADLPPDERRIILEARRVGKEAEIVVRDNGHGISPEALGLLFDSFYTTKAQGMGLGLSIARTLVEAHGGCISAESHPRKGARFLVRLPLGDKNSGEACEAPDPR
jgi:signal transduction histidine kinase